MHINCIAQRTHVNYLHVFVIHLFTVEAWKLIQYCYHFVHGYQRIRQKKGTTHHAMNEI